MGFVVPLLWARVPRCCAGGRGHLGAAEPRGEKGTALVTTTLPWGARGCVTARLMLSTSPPARGAGGDTSLTGAGRRCQRESLVVSAGIRSQARLWLPAAAPSGGEHGAELILGCVHACGEVLS